MPTWTVKVDRRRGDVDELIARLETLADSVRGLTVSIVDETVYGDAPDAGGFRDFAPVAHLTHQNIRGLEVVGEQLIVEFGWLIDLARDGAGD